MEKKVLMIVAPQNFRDEEYFEPKKVLEDNGFEVVTASKGVEVAVGRFGNSANIDIDIDVANPKNYDAVVFVGGNGAVVYREDKDISRILDIATKNDQLIGAICIAPTVLAQNGVLKGRKATVWNRDGETGKFIASKGAHYTGANVEEDGNIITADGPDSAKAFGEKLVEYLNLH